MLLLYLTLRRYYCKHLIPYNSNGAQPRYYYTLCNVSILIVVPCYIFKDMQTDIIIFLEN